jgi:hypothetical protein
VAHAQRVGNAESSRFAGAELTSAEPSRPSLQVLAVHLEKVIEDRNRHTAAVVGNSDALTAGEYRHLNAR